MFQEGQLLLEDVRQQSAFFNDIVVSLQYCSLPYFAKIVHYILLYIVNYFI